MTVEEGAGVVVIGWPVDISISKFLPLSSIRSTPHKDLHTNTRKSRRFVFRGNIVIFIMREEKAYVK